MSIESVMPSNHIILRQPRLFLPSIFPSIRVFANELVLHTRWPKYWRSSFSISPSSVYSGLICFRFGWFDLLAVQGTLKDLLQHHSSKASILHAQHSLQSSSHILVNKAEVDVFLELLLFLWSYGCNLISGSSVFSKSSLNIWKFMLHVLLKPSLENIEHYFANVWYECNLAVVWTFFDIAFL